MSAKLPQTRREMELSLTMTTPQQFIKGDQSIESTHRS